MATSGLLNTCASVVGRGLFAGALATGPMSGVMLAGKLLGLMGTPPPKEITAKAAIAAVTTPHDASAIGGIVRFPGAAPSDSFPALWMGGHVLYGAACGGGYALLHRRLLPRVPAWLHGAGFGLLVWGFSYLAWVPALGLYPRPERDSPGRMATMIVAHVVFGVTLAEINRRLDECESRVTQV